MNAKETSAVRTIIDELQRGLRFLKSERVALCMVNKYPNGLSYVNKAGEGLDPLNRHCGSELQLVENALRDAMNLLTTRGHEVLQLKNTAKMRITPVGGEACGVC